MVRTFIRVFVVAATLSLFPAFVFAQAAITGVVKDASGAVLPGVTVEAASPVLIEKVRSVVTDGTGQYRIVNLRPGTYSVTFTLTGLQHRQARRHRADRHVRRDGERRPEGRRARGDDHGHRRDADRRRPEREGAADGEQGHPGRHPELAERRAASSPGSGHEHRRRMPAASPAERAAAPGPSTAGAQRFADL